ncbi:MAG: C40 family peptidase [Muribaculaceae bacterium]|nr:C40 family peptidase [Muribaculaceae bacterium]
MKCKALHIISIASLLLLMIFTACGPAKNTQRGNSYDRSQPLTSREKKELVKEAKKWLGTSYRYGGHSRQGTDCSGMVMEVYRKVCNVSLPHSSREQQAYCKGIKKKDLTEGDLIFFCTGSSGRVSHVGMYIGDGKMVHASSSRGVIISALDERYYSRTYHSSGRVLASASSPKVADEHPTPSPAPVVDQPTTPQQLEVESTLPQQLELQHEIDLQDIIDAKVDSIYTNMFD